MDPAALFDAFVAAPSFSKILQSFSQMCTILNIDQCESFSIYRRLKEEIKDWKAEKLWALLDKRAAHKEYCHQKACERLNVLVIGAGPCGLRSAIECALLGSRVILVEQRDRFSRNNVLHIWPFVIQDLKDLGIKIFYPKFCRGSIDHISIRQLQCALLKVALVLGVQVHESVGFKRLIFPKADKSGNVRGWRAEFIPSEHFLSEYEFDVLIGADGKRNTVPGFPKREMRGKLAIGITANFVNKKTIEEEKVQEISGVAYIFNQQFFKEMKEATGIDLENIVYYKDETHYFVMCVKKQSLLDKGVILEDSEDVAALLAPSNVDQEKLCLLAAEAADFATAGKLPKLVYAQNHNGENDVAMFDFTSLFSAECSVRLGERCDRRLLMTIVGDTLHEPFWPTGSGCARGFLGVFDAAWMIRSYGLNKQGTMALLAERESIYRLLGQATSDNLQKQVHKYTIDPRTRYVSFEVSVEPYEISHLIDTDNPRNVEVDKALPLAHKTSVHDQNTPFISRYRLLRFCQRTLYPFKLKMYDFKTCWEDGRALSAIVARYRPDLLDYLALLSSNDSNSMFLETVNIIKNELGLEPVCDGLSEWQHLDEDKRVFYLHALMNILLSDIDRIRSVLVPSVKSTSTIHKRKFDASRSKKSDPIKQRTASLLDSFAATHNVPVCSADESSTAKCNEQFSSFLHISKQIASKVQFFRQYLI
ncbi:hypothetical protein AB6A40_005040 [Gnathostoma spinigerum]|uniref:F-actin monooxygenase n=1 Tax=Gnathostoma spinigerum TaxID=75299 RepID=A0ABD6EGJ8_9BILA